jgi:DNA-binding LacI/PurR family transcriptional regulator
MADVRVKRPTIRDVATEAGVSHQTVSRVINGHANVTAATRERVHTAIRDLSYVPSPMARALISNRTHSLGLVTADISDWFFAEAAAGAEVATRKRGYYLMIASVEDAAPDDAAAYLRLMLERRVEGLMIARPSLPLAVEQIRPDPTTAFPIVAIGSARLAGVTVVDVDNRQGGFDATSFLIERGHSRIAVLVGPEKWPSAVERLDGYRDALRSAGVREDAAMIERAGDWGLGAGQAAVARLLEAGTEFTAIFAHSDLLALGAIGELRARGLRVPEDISVVGYDDIPIAAFGTPPLTTVRQPMRAVGELAANVLLDAVGWDVDGRHRDGGSPELHLLPTKLVVRDSVASR